MPDHVIIVAGGSGSRMQSTLPKQFLELRGKPVLMHTIQSFYQYNPQLNIIVVMNPEYIVYWEDVCRTFEFRLDHRVIAGGKERYYSVRAGMDAIEGSDGVVAIHDAVRPLVSESTIRVSFETARKKGSAIPVVDVTDSLRMSTPEGSKAVNRSEYHIVQTPQCFQVALIQKAYGAPYAPSFTDDAAVAEAFGIPIHLVEGNRENIKLTTPADLRIAEALLNEA